MAVFHFIKVLEVHMRRLLTKGVVILAVLFSLGINSAAQNPTRESLESKKKRLSALEASMAESRSKILEIDVQLMTLKELRAELQKSIEAQKEESSRLLEAIPIEEEALAFLDSPPRKVLAVSGSDTYLIDFDGAPRLVKLHGLYIDPLKSAAIAKALKKRLVKKLVYFRCADVACQQ